MDFQPLVAMALLIFTIINFVRFVVGRDRNGIITTLSVWIAGVVVTLLVAQTDFASTINIGEFTLATLNLWSLLFIGLTVSSMATFGNEILGAVDRHRTTAKPHLVQGD